MFKSFTLVLTALAAFFMAGCSTTPASHEQRDALVDNAQAALNEMIAEDPGLKTLIHDAWGYAVFPSVGKGAAIAGGAWGRGIVYEHGSMAGYCDVSQATIGLQLGGEEFQELILFQNKEALERFRIGALKFAANASAVAIKSGASTTANYENGVAVFSRVKGGLMFEAAVGGQKFNYVAGVEVE